MQSFVKTKQILFTWFDEKSRKQSLHNFGHLPADNIREHINLSDDRDPFFRANFAKLCGSICEIPLHYYPQIPYIPRPVCIVVLTDNNSKYKEIIVTCNTKMHYIRPLMIKIHIIILINII